MQVCKQIEPHIGAKSHPRWVDRCIAEIARRQHGIVARSQLLEVGVGRRAIGHRLGAARLHIVHRGVYAVGHPLIGAYGRWMAAVLACGADAVLSHRAAGALFGLLRSGRLEATVPRQRPGPPRIAVHRSPLPDDEVTTVAGIPVTSELEALFGRFLRTRRLPRPEFNADLFVAGRWYQVDCLWRPERLIVELDGRSTHSASQPLAGAPRGDAGS